jgi:malonate decarboxylase epsilon subunit
MRTAFLYPGQGSQTPKYLHELPEHEVVRATFAEAGAVLGLDARELDNEAALQSTVGVQLGALIAGVAYTRLLSEAQFRPDSVAGLSVGAFAAAVAAGALSFADALLLVKLRSEAMENAYRSGYGMAAVVGLGEREVTRLLETVASPDRPLYLASVNAPTETVLSGSDPALDAAGQAAQTLGGRLRRLAVSVPSHCPLLAGVSDRLRDAIREIDLHRPQIPYVGNHRPRVLTTGAGIAEDLVLNVSSTVRWHESLALLYELGCRLFVEMPPGRTLTNLVKGSFPAAQAIAAADAGYDSVLYALRHSSAHQ